MHVSHKLCELAGKSTLLDILSQRKGGRTSGQVCRAPNRA